MIKVITAEGKTADNVNVLVKTGANTAAQIAEGYQIYDNGGAKAIRMFYELNKAPVMPVISRIYEEANIDTFDVIVEVEPSVNDSVEYRFAWDETSIVSNDEWQTANRHEIPPCISEVRISVRGIRNGAYSDVVTQTYLVDHDTWHNSYMYVSNGVQGGSYGTHSIYCADCGEYIGEEECTEGDGGLCIYCGETTA